MYPSDYGYATSGSSTTDRTACLNKELHSWDSSSDCYDNDWLFNSNYQWTLSPDANSTYARFAFCVYDSGLVNGYSANIDYDVRPVVYLLPNVKISKGNGKKVNPYQLEL